jgi:hypothetical protein
MGPKSIVNCWLTIIFFLSFVSWTNLYFNDTYKFLIITTGAKALLDSSKKWPYICTENINNTRTGREPCDWEPSQSSTMTQLDMLYQWDNSPPHGSPKGRPATKKEREISLFFWHPHTWFFFKRLELMVD